MVANDATKLGRYVRWMFSQPVEVLPQWDRLTFMALAYYFDENGEAVVSAPKLAETTGESTASIQNHINSMVANRVIEKTNRLSKRGATLKNSYRFLHLDELEDA